MNADEDAQCAIDFEEVMRPGGFRAWRFQSDMVGGRPWRPQLPSNLESCDVFLLATTANALESDTCEKEWQHAALIQKPVVTVVFVRGIHPPSPLNDHQWVRFDGSAESGARLISALQNAQPVPWETIPDDWKTRDGKTKAELSSIKTRRREIPLPRMRRRLTDLEKDNFLNEAVAGFRNYFGQALSEFEATVTQIQTTISDESNTLFKCQVYLNGDIKKSCAIWKSDNLGINGIAYSEAHGRMTSFSRNSFNELAQVAELDGRPALKFTLGLTMFSQNEDCRICTIDKAAECLWQYFIRDFDDSSTYW
ncbi:MAG: TIR domain-containing protein [Chloroflexi bacterium]|nr:TIR domain-containing protein [Chloroflexota bacterium]